MTDTTDRSREAAATLVQSQHRAALAACRRYGIPEQHAPAVARLMRDLTAEETR